MKIWNWWLQLLYPTTCVFCGKVLKEPVCSVCKEKVVYVEEPRCKVCGKPIRYMEEECCSDCKEQSHFFEQGRSVWLHKGPVRWSIYQFKYHNRRIFAQYYAKELYRLHGKKLVDWEIDLIVPIPLHRRRKRRRGYNQSELLAKQLSKLSGIPMNVNGVIRVKNTRPQKALTGKERKKNMQGAFRICDWGNAPKNVLLIDDIYTTGNTLDAVAKLLQEKGSKVFFFTISIGQGF